MLTYPHIDPIALELGPLKVHWYGVMYLCAFATAWWLARHRAGHRGSGWSREQVSDLIFYGALGVVLGGRLGYVLFYALDRFLADPFYLVRVWEGGMSFHGGLIGVTVALWLYGRRIGRSLLEVGDVVAPLVPLGLGFGRIGNFINGELWGRPSDLPWAIRLEPGGLAYHPSQLYEAALEGVVLFLVVWLYSSRPRPTGSVAGLFLAGYGVFRFLVEFVRSPDAHIGYLAWGWLTMGQLLSLPMVIAGAGLMAWARRRGSPPPMESTRP